jgi:hypothetical protein
MSKKFTYYGGIQTSLLPYLTAYWTADNIATDVYVNNLGGAWNSSSHYATGINGEAFDFGSGNQIRYVDVPDNDLLSFTDGTNDVPFTINMWTYFYSFSSTGNRLINRRDTNSTPSAEFQFTYLTSLGSIGFAKYSQSVNTNRIETLASVAPSLNTWEMWTVTSDGSKFGEKIYRNGIDVTGAASEVGTYLKMNNTNSNTKFGQAGFQPADQRLKHRGMIDELSIFNGTELTQLQVQDLYNGGVGKFYPNI